MNVPFLDLKKQYHSIQDEVNSSIAEVMANTAFAGGPYVEQFEKAFAAAHNTTFAVGVGSGTEALWLALLALGVGAGDEVITTSNTFIATAESISWCGAKPVFVDVDDTTCNMDPVLLEAAITARTRAIIPVHLFGQMADMTSICQIAAKHNIPVVEDASQAHLAEHDKQKAGSIAELGCFSFYPGKNLGAYGEAGAVTTNNEELALNLRMIRDHGQSKKYYHDIVGCNARMDGIQGAVLSVKLKHLHAWTDARREHAAHYNRLLDGINNLRLPVEADGNKHVYHIYAIRVSDRDAIMKKLAENGIGSGIHYPLPLHLQKAYQHLGYDKGDFPVSERICSELLSLPMYAELEEEQIEYVADKLADIIE